MLTGKDMLTEDVLNDENEQLEQLFQRWMLGSEVGLTEKDLPESWRPVLADLPPDELPLAALALASHHQTVLFEEQPPADLKAVALLPELAQPVLSDSLRSLFRRIVNNKNRHDASDTGQLLWLMLYRGYSAHPADWMPSATQSAMDDIPEIYLPWSRWRAERELADYNAEQSDTLAANGLTEDNWDQWFPAERIQQLKRLRSLDAAAARTLITACYLREPAEKRLNIIKVLALNLSEEDTEFLQGLATDRSQKIVRLASQYLARLGQYASEQADTDGQDNASEIAAELAQTLEYKKTGLLKKRSQLVPVKLKSKKQQAIRSEQLEQVSLPVLAEALGCSLEELVGAWMFTQHRSHDNEVFISNAVNTLSESLLQVLLQNLMASLSHLDRGVYYVCQFLPRLPEPQRIALAGQLLLDNACDFSDMLSFLSMKQPFEAITWASLKQLNVWKKLTGTIKKELVSETYLNQYWIENELKALGLLLPSELARQVLDNLVDLGVLRADPAIDYLTFNAELSSV